MRTMPPKPRKAYMTPAQFRAILAKAKVKNTHAAVMLGVARTTVIRWLNESTPISRANARLIREVFQPEKK